MEQQQFRVSRSIGTKLLVSVVSLLFVVILFLNLSTILVLKEDKRAYTYQSQATEAQLVGREFLRMARQGFDTLRFALASVDPLHPATPQQRAAIDAALKNQSELIGLRIRMLNPETGDRKSIVDSWNSEELARVGFKTEDANIPDDLFKLLKKDLLEQGYGYANLSKPGSAAILALLVVDKKFAKSSVGIPIAIGFVSLGGLGKELHGSRITVTNREGWVLFDTNPEVFYTQSNIADHPLFETLAKSQLASGTQEFDLKDVHYLGSYTRPGLGLAVFSSTEWRKAMKATYALTEKFILLGLIAIGLAIIFALVFSKTLVAPINRLYNATKEVSQGNFNIELAQTGSDEITALTDSFVAMSKKIVGLIKESMERVRLEGEIAIASTVQQTLFPPTEFKHRNIHIHSHYQSASECGGDWWGFFGVGDKLCMMIADATGHGIPSALITASARSCFSVMHKLAQEDPDFTYSPGSMLSYANRVVHDSASGKIMMTFFVGVVDFSTKTLTYASAGHNPPWLFKKADGKFALKSLVAQGQRLGEARDVPPYAEGTVELTPGDILFLYTDGLMEGKNVGGEMYGKKKTRQVVEKALTTGADKVIKTLITDFMAHNGEKPLDDDVTLAAALMFPEEMGATGQAAKA